LNNDLSKLKKRGYISISLQTWHNHLYHKNKLPQNCVIICFIGGLTEHYQFAFNALKQNNLKGTFFVPSLKKSKNKHSLMNPFMIKELDLNGMEIGVYIDSENLKHLSSLIEIKNELQEIVNQKIRFISSKNKIEKFKIKYSKVGFAGSINFFSFFSQPIQKKIIKSFFISNNY
jgi:ribosomal protein L5